MRLDYVDIFYSHRPDPATPIEETMSALHHIVTSGKALYVGISSYDSDRTRHAAAILRELGTSCLIHQPSYSMLNRWIENGLLDVLADEGMGCIAFSPLAQGRLTDRYLDGIPAGSRATKPHGFLKPKDITPVILERVSRLRDLARARSQSMAQMAIAWVLRLPGMTSALIGASGVAQIEDAVGALHRLDFNASELQTIDQILAT
jgi:L-glyceraldehyde 3-phosphate reductase